MMVVELHAGEVRCCCVTEGRGVFTGVRSLQTGCSMNSVDQSSHNCFVSRRSGGADGVAKHYDIATAAVKRTFIGHSRPITAVQVDPTPFGTEGLFTGAADDAVRR